MTEGLAHRRRARSVCVCGIGSRCRARLRTSMSTLWLGATPLRCSQQ